MPIDKIRALITAVCLFFLSAFSLIVAIYLTEAAVRLISEVHNFLGVLRLGIFIIWLLHWAFVSLVYTVRFAARCKSSIIECWGSAAQIAPSPTFEAQQPQMAQPQNQVNKMMIGSTWVLSIFTLWYFSLLGLVGAIYAMGHSSLETQDPVDVLFDRLVLLLLLILAFVCLVVLVIIPAVCIYWIIDDCCGGNKIAPTPMSVEGSTSMKEPEIKPILQPSKQEEQREKETQLANQLSYII